MKLFNHILLIALGVVLLSSCSKEPLMGGDEPLPKGTVGIQILLPASADTQVQGAESDAAKAESDGGRTSRATVPRPPVPGTESENRINNLKFFIAHTAADGKEVIKRIVEVKDVSVSYGEMETDAKWDSGNNMLYVRHMKNPEELHKVFVVANWADMPATIVEGAPLETLTGAITHLAAAIPTPDDKHPMVMSGFAVDHNFATTPLVKVPIEHQAARLKLDVGLSYAFNEAYKNELVFGDPIDKHISVEVGNTYNSSYVFRQAPPAIPASAAELPISFQIAYTTPSPDNPDGNLWMSPAEFFLYLYENPVAGITEYAKAHATYFLINIPYYKKNDPTKQLTNNYYKFKVNDINVTNPNPHAILRNTYYEAIGFAMGFGSEDPMKAVEIAAEVTVKPWSDIDVDGDITDQKPPINSKLEILSTDPRVVYVNNVRDAALSRINFWTDRPAAEVLLDPIVKTGENFDTDINLTDYFEGTTDLHLTPNTDGKGGFDGYIDLNYIDGKVLPGVNMMKMKIKLTAGGITKELTVRFSHVMNRLIYDTGSTLHDYHQWTGTVADGGNGVYQDPTPQSWAMDRPYARFEIASADATKDLVDWTTARTSCPSGWRLPRSGELSDFTEFPYSPHFMPVIGKTYWSASETRADWAYAVEFLPDNYPQRSNNIKTAKHSVRCVRNEEVPNKVYVAYVPWDPKYCLDYPNNAIYDVGVQIGNLFNQHPVYGFDAWYTANGQRYQAGDIVPKHVKNLILFCGWAKPFRLGNLELSYKSFTGLSWGEARGLGKGANNYVINDPYKLGTLYTGCNGQFRENEGWRLPTLEELALISNNFFLLRMNGVEVEKEPYWSANDTDIPNWAWSFNLMDNSTKDLQKYHGIRSMCVRTVK